MISIRYVCTHSTYCTYVSHITHHITQHHILPVTLCITYFKSVLGNNSGYPSLTSTHTFEKKKTWGCGVPRVFSITGWFSPPHPRARAGERKKATNTFIFQNFLAFLRRSSSGYFYFYFFFCWFPSFFSFTILFILSLLLTFISSILYSFLPSFFSLFSPSFITLSLPNLFLYDVLYVGLSVGRWSCFLIWIIKHSLTLSFPTFGFSLM